MAGFLTPLHVKEVGDDRHWQLLEPCVYHLQGPDGREWVEAPIGFVTDFGSIPRPMWGLPGLSPHGRFRRAYVIHDKLYAAPVIRTATSARVITRDEADRVLLEALDVLGANWLNRRVIYRGVRLGGSFAWRSYRAQDAARL